MGRAEDGLGTGERVPWEHVFVSIKGSPYARFRRALELGNLALVYAEAAELPHVQLDDALAVCVLMAREGHPAFERAAVRWVARLCLERRLGLREARAALALVETLPEDPEGARRSLLALATRRSGR